MISGFGPAIRSSPELGAEVEFCEQFDWDQLDAVLCFFQKLFLSKSAVSFKIDVYDVKLCHQRQF
jgi:hypothetical protein